MSKTTGFPEVQPDGSYRVPTDDPNEALIRWGTVRFWAVEHQVFVHRNRLKVLLRAAFPTLICVDEGCEQSIFPESVVSRVVLQLREDLRKEAERLRLSRN